MLRSGPVDTLMEFGLASLSGARRGYMPPRLKTNKTNWMVAALLDNNWFIVDNFYPYKWSQISFEIVFEMAQISTKF